MLRSRIGGDLALGKPYKLCCEGSPTTGSFYLRISASLSLTYLRCFSNRSSSSYSLRRPSTILTRSRDFLCSRPGSSSFIDLCSSACLTFCRCSSFKFSCSCYLRSSLSFCISRFIFFCRKVEIISIVRSLYVASSMCIWCYQIGRC